MAVVIRTASFHLRDLQAGLQMGSSRPKYFRVRSSGGHSESSMVSRAMVGWHWADSFDQLYAHPLSPLPWQRGEI